MILYLTKLKGLKIFVKIYFFFLRNGYGSMKNRVRKRSIVKDETISSNKRTKPALNEIKVGNSKLGGREQNNETGKIKMKNIGKIHYLNYEIDALFYSAYPIARFSFVHKLYICHKTFKYMKKPVTYSTHLTKMKEISNPPGKRIYKDMFNKKSIEVYKINGQKEKLFGQNLCLFSKLFIKHKNTRYDPEPFIFYLLIERTENSFFPVGYYSREKESKHNLSCILVFPPFQGQGYGRFLISLSYEMTKLSGKIGSPEKPLSKSGKKSYRSYWSYIILSLLDKSWQENENPLLNLTEIGQKTKIKVEDILSTLDSLKFIKKSKAGLAIYFNKELVRQKLKVFKSYSKSLCVEEKLCPD